jgi:hypothetical protein
MAVVLVATGRGCYVYNDDGDSALELPHKHIWAIAPDIDSACVAIVNEREIWRRDAAATWSHVATADVPLASIVSMNGNLFVGGETEASLSTITSAGEVKRMTAFDRTPGRNTWVANGPPLHTRSLTITADGSAMMAAVHIGGIPRSTDGAATWMPTIPIQFDVHEVRAHPSLPIVAAATGAGLCISENNGQTWRRLTEKFDGSTSLAVAVLQDDVLFSVQDGPFASRSQIWRWKIGNTHVEPLRHGLPEWLDGKVDTAHLAANKNQAAVVDGGGNLWLSETGTTNWKRLATGLNDAMGLHLL